MREIGHCCDDRRGGTSIRSAFDIIIVSDVVVHTCMFVGTLCVVARIYGSSGIAVLAAIVTEVSLAGSLPLAMSRRNRTCGGCSMTCIVDVVVNGRQRGVRTASRQHNITSDTLLSIASRGLAFADSRGLYLPDELVVLVVVIVVALVVALALVVAFALVLVVALAFTFDVYV